MISIQSQRVFFSNNGTLTDISKVVNNNKSGGQTVIDFVNGEDYIYIGTPIPITNRFIDVSVVNDQASVASAEIWDGDSWEAAVDFIDETNGLFSDGVVQWTTDKDKAWGKESTTEDVPALSTLKIYNMYWMRLNFTADLNALTALNYIGWRFSADADLGALYPDLVDSTVMSRFETGKTDWHDQHVAAAEIIIADLIRQQYIESGNQIFAYEQFNLAAVHKVAEIVYNSFGDNFTDQRDESRRQYKHHLKQGVYIIDRDKDGYKDIRESNRSIGIRRV